MAKKVILCIMDGFGVREQVVYGNAIKQAHTPNIDYLNQVIYDEVIGDNDLNYILYEFVR